jgi:N-acetyl-gamma-glutamyl-phosphate reductase common form
VKRVGLIGARGHTGRELLGLLANHDGVSVEVACSSSAAGKPVRAVVTGWPTDLVFTAPSPAVTRGLDAVVLALPNGASEAYVEEIESHSPKTAVIDLSADHRFDERWTYGLPERDRDRLAGASRIANPGCYATGMQLALAPFLDVLDGDATVFGVSGYSGAGTSPSRKNDPEVLRDNLLPYALQGHVHEREASRHLGHAVRFHPHVASFFRGISLTVSATTSSPLSIEDARARLRARYDAEALVEVIDEIPEVRDVQGRHLVRIGGVTTDDRRLALVSTIDNLLKGAATQALQNLNLALGLDELAGIELSGSGASTPSAR